MIRTKWFKVNILKAPSGRYRWSIFQGETALASGMGATRGKAQEQMTEARTDLMKRLGIIDERKR